MRVGVDMRYPTSNVRHPFVGYVNIFARVRKYLLVCLEPTFHFFSQGSLEFNSEKALMSDEGS